MLSARHNQFHTCWCSGDFRSHGISRHGINPQSGNILSPASKELRLGSFWCSHNGWIVTMAEFISSQMLYWWMSFTRQLILDIMQFDVTQFYIHLENDRQYIFSTYPCTRNPTARLWGQAMGCLLWVIQASTYWQSTVFVQLLEHITTLGGPK